MGEVEKNGGKWITTGEKWEDMGENGGKWGNSRYCAPDVGCGGLWQEVVEENGRKMGEKRQEIPVFHSTISPTFPDVEGLPHNSLCKKQLTALTDGKTMGFVTTHRHSPPRWLVRMLGLLWCMCGHVPPQQASCRRTAQGGKVLGP